MPRLDLSHTHAAILCEYLKRELSDLSVEIAGTDRKNYRDEIKAERRLLRDVLEKLERLDEDAPRRR